MWKTIGFQQLFRFFPLWETDGETAHSGLHNIGYNPVTPALRHRETEVPSTRKQAKLFASPENMLSKAVVSVAAAEIICEKSPKYFLVSYFPRWKYFS